MSYDEFWLYDYRLTESYEIKRDRDLEEKVSFNYQIAEYIQISTRKLAEEIGEMLSGKKNSDKTKFPEKPNVTKQSQLLAERDKRIENEYRQQIQKLRERRKNGE